MTKSAAIPEELMSQQLKGASVTPRFEQWRRRIDSWKGDRPCAQELYSGSNWSVVRRLAAINSAKRHDLQCHVISAGFGLVRFDAPLAPYAATFLTGLDDSVASDVGQKGSAQNREWWEALSTWRPYGVSGPRSLRQAFEENPDSVHFFALSPLYFDAIAVDLSLASAALSNPENLVIISTGKKRHGALTEYVLSASARLQTHLGGALGSLNVRVAAEILRSIPKGKVNRSSAATILATLISKSHPRQIPKRNLITDSEAIAFIVRSIKGRDSASYTGLLRELRKTGRACEMKRFKTLFKTVMASL